MGLKEVTVPNLTAGYSALLGQNLWLQEHHGWQDYLLPVSDSLAAISILVGNNVGSFVVQESNSPDQRWLWLSPEAIEHLRRQNYSILDSAVRLDEMDVEAAYQDILKTLGRDPRGYRVK